MVQRGQFRVATVVAAIGGVTCAGVADEVSVQNDSLQDGQTGAIQAGFIGGESAAAWLTSPCDGSIVAVQVLWLSLFQNTGQSLEDSITIYAAGTFPNPGSELAFLEAPLMTDGFLNEFRYLDKNSTIPLDVPVSAGQKFIVSFKFFNDPDPFLGPSVVTDLNGCQAQKNAIFATPGGWLNFCAFGPSGDFVIRGVVECGELPGACCLAGGGCIGDLTESACDAAGGVYQGGASTCRSITCPQPGACCLATGQCVDGVNSTQCTQQGGIYQGNGSSCSTADCPQPTGACCFDTGFCLSLTDGNCNSAGGAFQGAGVSCIGGICSLGACCFDSGFCLQLSEADCLGAGAAFSGLLTQCDPGDTCPSDPGKCPADLNDDGNVGPADLGSLLAAWGTDPGGPPDFNDDNTVGPADLGELLATWGPCE